MDVLTDNTITGGRLPAGRDLRGGYEAHYSQASWGIDAARYMAAGSHMRYEITADRRDDFVAPTLAGRADGC